MRGPGIPANATREQLVNNLDVVATILDVAGAAPWPALSPTGAHFRRSLPTPTLLGGVRF